MVICSAEKNKAQSKIGNVEGVAIFKWDGRDEGANHGDVWGRTSQAEHRALQRLAPGIVRKEGTRSLERTEPGAGSGVEGGVTVLLGLWL